MDILHSSLPLELFAYNCYLFTAIYMPTDDYLSTTGYLPEAVYLLIAVCQSATATYLH
jgi:hypothetical protein